MCCCLCCTIVEGMTYKSFCTFPSIMMDFAVGLGSSSVTITLSPPNMVYKPSLSNSRGDMSVCGK
eukprot:Pgem_evm2s11957